MTTSRLAEIHVEQGYELDGPYPPEMRDNSRSMFGPTRVVISVWRFIEAGRAYGSVRVFGNRTKTGKRTEGSYVIEPDRTIREDMRTGAAPDWLQEFVTEHLPEIEKRIA